MPITPPDNAKRGIRVIEDAINDLVSTPGFLRQILGSIPAGEGAVSAPHTIHNLGLRSLAGGEGLDAAAPAAVGYLLLEDDRAIATVEVLLDESGTPSEFGSFTRGAEFKRMVRVIDSLDRLEQVRRGSFELRMLQVPALHVRAVWLHDQDGDEDLVVPIASPPGVRLGDDARPAGEFLDDLRGLAEAALSQGDAEL